jgi:Tfp pilus assembly PilM family ATPase
MAVSGLGKLASLTSWRGVGSLRGQAPPLAIDFGVGSLKLLQITAGPPVHLVAAAQLDTPEELLADPVRRLRFQLDALPKLVRSGGFKSQRAVCTIPTPSLFCKHLQVQRADGVDLGEITRAAAARTIGCDPSVLLCRHVPVKDVGPGRAELVCFATPRELVARLMTAIKGARLEPVGIHAEPQALVHAVASGPGASEDDRPTLLLDMGRRTTKVVIARGTEIRFARVIEFGGLDLDQAVARQTQSSLARAVETRLGLSELTERRDDAAGETPEKRGDDGLEQFEQAVAEAAGKRATLVRPVRPRVDLSEPLEILTDEVAMCLRYDRAQFPDAPAERIVFVGGESRHEALCGHIARTLRMPAQAADPTARIGRSGKEPTSGVRFDEPQPGWAVALGLCYAPTDL